jgi:hypothetical protein
MTELGGSRAQVSAGLGEDIEPERARRQVYRGPACCSRAAIRSRSGSRPTRIALTRHRRRGRGVGQTGAGQRS